MFFLQSESECLKMLQSTVKMRKNVSLFTHFKKEHLTKERLLDHPNTARLGEPSRLEPVGERPGQPRTIRNVGTNDLHILGTSCSTKSYDEGNGRYKQFTGCHPVNQPSYQFPACYPIRRLHADLKRRNRATLLYKHMYLNRTALYGFRSFEHYFP